jgi:hypothetical protein
MPEDGMGLVGRREVGEFVVGELEFSGLYCIIDMMRFCCADDRRGYAGLMKDPGQGNLGIGDAALLRDFGHMLDDLEIVLFIVKTVLV